MAFFDNPIAQLGSTTDVFTLLDVIIVLIISTILTFIVAYTYMKTHEGISYSKEYVQIIVVFGICVSMIMLIIGSNIARAFTLVGALSIVRFRNAIKSTKDVGYIFFMMTVGMSVGVRFYLLAITLTFFVCAVLFFMKSVNFGAKHDISRILKVTVDADNPKEDTITKDFNKYLLEYDMLSIETTENPKLNELVFLVKPKDKSSETKLIEYIKTRNGGKPVYIIGTQNYIQ